MTPSLDQQEHLSASKREHLPGYQRRDFEIIDYQLYSLGETGLWFRGPDPQAALKVRPYFVCIGAAQTLGCFCDRPFPTLLSEAWEMPVLNLGYGGAGPAFYMKHPALIDTINQAEFVVVQVMSGRSESNSRFESGGLELLTDRRTGKQLGANAAYKALLEESPWRKVPMGQRYFRKIDGVCGAQSAKRIVAETRRNWIESYQTLLDRITVPKVLLWFSVRSPDYSERYDRLKNLFGDFPQLVNRQMVEAIKTSCSEYVECVSKRGMPQPLISRFTNQPTQIDPSLDRPDLGGKLWSHNRYYPSPEMHSDAAQMLSLACKKYF